VRSLVLECGVDASTANEWGMSLLHAAVAMDHTEKVRILVENGTDPNTTSQWGTTPISIAACNGCTRTVLSLVQEFDTSRCKEWQRAPQECGRGEETLASRNRAMVMIAGWWL
jgi:hypothetical protein